MVDYDSFDEFRDPETYDLECDEVDEELPLIELWARSAGGDRVLDLACGTGRTALRLARRGFQVTGVDLMPEMVARGREKAATQSLTVEWVVADARTVQLHGQFSSAYMVGNAFQMFYTRADQETLFARVREHLLLEGNFIFETRNPSPRNLSAVWHPEPRTYTTPGGGQLVVTEEPSVYDPLTQIQHRSSRYRWLAPDGRQVETSKHIALRYVFPQEIEALLHYNGFSIRATYGDWQGNPLAADSPEMIFVCQPRG